LQIIIVHPKLKQARTLTLRPHWIAAAGLGLILLLAAGSGLLSYVTFTHVHELRLPLVQRWLARSVNHDVEHEQAYVRQNIEALAAKLGQLQAQISRIDAVGERVARIAGVRAPEPPARPGLGGPAVTDVSGISLDRLAEQVDHALRGADRRDELFSVLETELMMRSVMARLLPNSQPLEGGVAGSRFGWRADPFTGRSAMHEGIDFNAPIGTAIVAAGPGVVSFAGWHAAYGNQVDLDHGNGLVTRYAHASRLLVREGDIVRQGQKIAEVGSTGRSTGAHLHFEVRLDDQPQDPFTFLRDGLPTRGSRAAAPTGGPARAAR
jgi:murein DD-endopeptidase MepM/ murein hydrolase activator NlpD